MPCTSTASSYRCCLPDVHPQWTLHASSVETRNGRCEAIDGAFRSPHPTALLTFWGVLGLHTTPYPWHIEENSERVPPCASVTQHVSLSASAFVSASAGRLCVRASHCIPHFCVVCDQSYMLVTSYDAGQGPEMIVLH